MRGTTIGIAEVLAILLLGALAPMVQAQDLTLPKNGADPVVLLVPEGSPNEEMLEIYVQGAKTPIAGHYVIASNAISFAPAFGFEPGQDYVARIVWSGEESRIAFRMPDERMAVPAAVTNIYPSGTTLPENTLRFYIHFSVPMQPQVAFDHIKLRDASGTVDTAAFMRFKQELWNEDRTRLTVLIDPGRIKREVATNVELGPALRAGQKYTLSVEGGWPSADGTMVLPTFSKTFRVADALRTRPDIDRWTTNAPCAGTRDPLSVVFDRPFDRHLLAQMLRVGNDVGDEVEGTIDVEAAEQVWRFTPDRPWPADGILLVADPKLEDVAGNNFHDLLDHVAGQEESEFARTELLISTRNCTG